MTSESLPLYSVGRVHDHIDELRKPRLERITRPARMHMMRKGAPAWLRNDKIVGMFYNLIGEVEAGDEIHWHWYGQRVKGLPTYRRYSVRRLLWWLNMGELDRRLIVVPFCDDGECIRPEHLDTRNPYELVAPHGFPAGVRSRTSLTKDQVREIRRRVRAGGCQADIGREFGVDRITVWRIVKRRTWADVT